MTRTHRVGRVEARNSHSPLIWCTVACTKPAKQTHDVFTKNLHICACKDLPNRCTAEHTNTCTSKHTKAARQKHDVFTQHTCTSVRTKVCQTDARQSTQTPVPPNTQKLPDGCTTFSHNTLAHLCGQRSAKQMHTRHLHNKDMLIRYTAVLHTNPAKQMHDTCTAKMCCTDTRRSYAQILPNRCTTPAQQRCAAQTHNDPTHKPCQTDARHLQAAAKQNRAEAPRSWEARCAVDQKSKRHCRGKTIMWELLRSWANQGAVLQYLRWGGF